MADAGSSSHRVASAESGTQTFRNSETDDDDSNDSNNSQDGIQSSSASDLSSDSDDNSVPVTLLGAVGPSTTQQHGRAGRPRGHGGPWGNSHRGIRFVSSN